LMLCLPPPRARLLARRNPMVPIPFNFELPTVSVRAPGRTGCGLTRGRARVHSRMRWTVLALAALLGPWAAAFAAGFDEVILKNGRRFSGQIVSDTRESLVLAIDGGTVEFPRSAVASPPYFGAEEETPAAAPARETQPEDLAPHPIPSISVALRELRRFDWAADVRQVPALVTDRGRWRYLPCVSFWTGGFARLNFYGDPDRPAAVEVSLIDPPEDAWERKQELLEFILGVAPALALDDRFDHLDIHGDSFAIEDLWLAVTGPDSAESPGRWSVLLLHEVSIPESRASLDELQAISEPLKSATLDPTRPRSWQRGSWTVKDVEWLRRTTAIGHPGAMDDAVAAEAWTALGGERVFVRSFVRDGGKYARSSNDWLREVAANQPR
ncbi:MAG: hypothetical protein ACREIA_00605, partial [Opitutaceae bacterium]